MIPVIAILALALVFVGWRMLHRRAATGGTQYATATVQRGALETTVTNTGSLVSGLQQDLRPTISADVDEVLVKVGDSVKKGQALAKLSNPDLLNALAQARANLNAEEQRLSDMTDPKSDATANDIKNAQNKVTSCEQTLAQRQADVDGLTVKSPVEGLVGSVTVYPGDEPGAQTTLATVIDLSTLEFIANVPQESANYVHIGDRVTFHVNDITYYGTVKGVGPSLSGTNLITFPVTVSLDPTVVDQGLRPGMSGTYVFPAAQGKTGSSGSGTVTARTYTLKARASATVDSVSVNVGDKVTTGQTLMTLSSDDAQLALQQAQVDLENARVALNDLIAPPVTATSTDIASEEAKVTQMRTAYDNAQSDVDELTIVAPFDGIVTARNIDVGNKTSANASSAAFVIADFSNMSVSISVDELDVTKLKVGMDATVDVQAMSDQTYQAKVASISPQGSVSQGVATYPVELQLTDPQGLLAGMTANVTVICERRDNVLYVPIEAVTKVRDRSVVRVLDASGKESSVEVTTGLANDMYIEIVSGLTEGQTVITGSASSSSGSSMRLGGMGMGAGPVQSERTEAQPGGGK